MSAMEKQPNETLDQETSYENRDRARSIDDIPLEELPKGRWERLWPTIACGAGLFSDGYVQAVSRKLHCLKSLSVLDFLTARA